MMTVRMVYLIGKTLLYSAAIVAGIVWASMKGCQWLLDAIRLIGVNTTDALLRLLMAMLLLGPCAIVVCTGVLLLARRTTTKLYPIGAWVAYGCLAAFLAVLLVKLLYGAD